MVTIRTRRVTSADVAREAGVSRTTVSYVLNDTPHQKIPEETRQRVLDAVARLEYAPSAAARTLQRGRSDTVLCLLPNWPIGPAVGASLEHLSAALAARGLTLLAHPSAGSSRTLADAWRAVSPAAVVLFEDADEEDLAAMRAEGIQVTVALLAGGGGGEPAPGAARSRSRSSAPAGCRPSTSRRRVIAGSATRSRPTRESRASRGRGSRACVRRAPTWGSTTRSC